MSSMSRTAIVFAAGIMLAVYGSGMYYVARKLYRWLQLVVPHRQIVIFVAVCVVFVVSIAISFMPIELSVKKHLVWFAWLLIGIYVLFLTFFLFSEVGVLLGWLTRLIPRPTPGAVTVAIGWIVIACVAVSTAIGIYGGRQARPVSYSFTISGKETSLDSLNIVLISDTHLGYLNDEKWVAKLVDEINTAQPDIVVIAGDVFNDNFRALTNPDNAAASLREISATYGVYACLGNHDGGETFPEMLDFLERGNVKVLMDEYITVDDKFVVVGRSDPRPIGDGAPPRVDFGSVKEASVTDSDGLNTNMPVIVMDHQLGDMSEYEGAADLVMAGHTHQGQFFPATVITTLMNRELNHGYSQKDPGSPHVVVTAGAGLWGPPIRLGSSNEVVSISVQFE